MGVNAQQEAVALWLYLESRGFKPSVRMVARILRIELGLGRRESLVREWLALFADASGMRPVSTGDASGMRPRVARPKVSLVSNTSLPKPKKVRPLIPAVDFEDLEGAVAVYLASAAAGNKTGEVSEGRVLRLRFELFGKIQELGGNRTAFAHGLSVANGKGIANANYVYKAAIGYQERSHSNNPALFSDENESDLLPNFEDLPEFQSAT